MKAILLSSALGLALVGSAAAADLPVRGPVYKAPVMAPVVYNWTGFYVGGHVGWGWQDGTARLTAASGVFPAGTTVNSKTDGLLGGGQVGLNWQTGNIVLGLEADFSWTNANGSGSTTLAGLTSTGTIKYNWFSTATARVGFAANNWLFYVKGGAAFTDAELGGSLTAGPVVLATVNSQHDRRTGWTVGAGIEQGFAGNWSWKLEYNFMDFGTRTITSQTTPVLGPAAVTDNDGTAHAVKFGINYRFGGFGGPVVAKDERLGKNCAEIIFGRNPGGSLPSDGRGKPHALGRVATGFHAFGKFHVCPLHAASRKAIGAGTGT